MKDEMENFMTQAKYFLRKSGDNAGTISNLQTVQHEIQNGDIKGSVHFLSNTFQESTARIGEPKEGNPMIQKTNATTGAAAAAPPPPAPTAE